MKPLCILLLFLGCSITFSNAQKAGLINDSLVSLTTTSNSIFHGKIKAQEDNSILLGTKTGPINFPYSTIKNIRNNDGAVIFTPPPFTDDDTDPLSAYHSHKKPLYNLPDSLFNNNKQYEFWNKCWLIHNGDTVWVKVEPAEDYRQKSLISAVKRSGSTRTLAPADIVKMVIFYDDQHEPYIYASCAGPVGNFLSIVVVDGPCELLCYQKTRKKGGDPKWVIATYEETETRWIISYKGKATLMKRQFAKGDKKENDYVPFKSNCREIFAGCTSLLEKIENNIYDDDNLDQIVREFNDYLSKQ